MYMKKKTDKKKKKMKHFSTRCQSAFCQKQSPTPARADVPIEAHQSDVIEFIATAISRESLSEN